MRRVLICGDRFWTNYARILACVRKANATEHIDVIIEGECRGADYMGRRAGEEIGLTVENGGILPFPAQWEKYTRGKGNPAGPIRNQQMLDEGKPSECWAFHNNVVSSRGTKDMITRAMKANIQTYVISDSGWFQCARSLKGSAELSIL